MASSPPGSSTAVCSPALARPTGSYDYREGARRRSSTGTRDRRGLQAPRHDVARGRDRLSACAPGGSQRLRRSAVGRADPPKRVAPPRVDRAGPLARAEGWKVSFARMRRSPPDRFRRIALAERPRPNAAPSSRTADRPSCLRIEEVQRAEIDPDLDNVTLGRLRMRAEPPDDRCLLRRSPASCTTTRSSPMSSASSRMSSVTAGRAEIVKCTSTSAPSASRSSTRPRRCPTWGAVHSAASLRSSGRRPTHHCPADEEPSLGSSRPRASSRQGRERRLDRLVHAPFQHVHRRAADEAGDEHVGRAVVELLGRRDLLQLPLRMTATRSPIVIAST